MRQLITRQLQRLCIYRHHAHTALRCCLSLLAPRTIQLHTININSISSHVRLSSWSTCQQQQQLLQLQQQQQWLAAGAAGAFPTAQGSRPPLRGAQQISAGRPNHIGGGGNNGPQSCQQPPAGRGLLLPNASGGGGGGGIRRVNNKPGAARLSPPSSGRHVSPALRSSNAHGGPRQDHHQRQGQGNGRDDDTDGVNMGERVGRQEGNRPSATSATVASKRMTAKKNDSQALYVPKKSSRVGGGGGGDSGSAPPAPPATAAVPATGS